MSRQAQAIQWSLAIHLLMASAVIIPGGTLSTPVRIDLSDFALISAPVAKSLHDSSEALPPQSLQDVAAHAKSQGLPSQSAEPVAADTSPPEIEARKTKIKPFAAVPAADVSHTPPVTTEHQQKSLNNATVDVNGQDVFNAEGIAQQKAPPVSARPEASSSSTNGKTSSGRATHPVQSVAEQKRQYLARHYSYIRDQIMQNLTYPAIARKKGWTGQVKLSFLIKKDGSVDSIIIESGSGFAVLDRHAVDTVKKTAPFPAPPEQAEISIPITYALRN